LVAAVLRALRGGGGPVAIDSPGAPTLPTVTSPVPLDFNILSELTSEVGREQVNEMVALFFVETERRIALFRDYGDAIDRDTLAIEAHSLKGGAATLGFADVAEIAREIELGAAIVSADILDTQIADLAKALFELRRHCEASFKLAS
jgi:hypothetical protein